MWLEHVLFLYSVQEYGEIVFTFPVIVLVQLFLRFINVYLYVTLDLMTFFFSLFLIHSNLVYTFLWKYSLNLSKRHFPHISVIPEGNIARASVYRDCMHEWFVEFILSKMKMYIKQLLLCFSIAIIIKLYMYVLNLYFTLNV